METNLNSPKCNYAVAGGDLHVTLCVKSLNRENYSELLYRSVSQ